MADSTITQAELDDILMFKDHAIRFWKNKSDKAEKQLYREKMARTIAEETLEKYKRVPQELLEKLILESKEAEVKSLKCEAGCYLTNIGIHKWIQISREDGGIIDIDKKLEFWKEVVACYKQSRLDLDEPEESDDSDE